MTIKQFNRGFTLIEIMVVITIIAVLVSVITISFDSVRKKGRDTRRINDLRDLSSALIMYYQDFKSYPTDINNLISDYVKELPADPISGNHSFDCTEQFTYCYIEISDDEFILWAQLENENNPQLWNNSDATCTIDPATYFGADALFNYCHKSPPL